MHPRTLPQYSHIALTAVATIHTGRSTNFHSIIDYCVLDVQQEVEQLHLCILDYLLMYLPVMISVTSRMMLCKLQSLSNVMV